MSPALVLLSILAIGETKTYAKPDLLIEAADLAKADKFRILDARSREKYDVGHVPAAVWVDHAEWSKAFDNGRDPEGWSKRIGDLGIDTDTSVVIYDDASSKDAARIWWILRFWGIRDVRLLNGGWLAWKESSGKVATEAPKIRSVTVKLKPQNERLATKEEMLQGVKDKSFQIVDARSKDEYCGEVKSAKKGGAVPESKQLEWSDLLDAKTQRFKPAAELAKLFE